MKYQPLVSIMILGWNNYEDIINCLKSLKTIDYHNYNVILVENGSKEENFKKFIAWLKKSKTKHMLFNNEISEVKKSKLTGGKIFIIKNNYNLGFTGGSNLGLRFTWKICDPKYLLLLNGDTIVTKNFLTNLVEICQRDKNIGSVQSTLIRFNKKNIDSLGLEMKGYRIFDSSQGKDKSVLNDLKNNEEIFGACGAAALYRADIITKIGLFDEGLFATFEDFDLAWRIRLEGLKSVLVKNSTVYHRGGVSRRKSDHVIFDRRSYYGARNLLVVYNRYYPITINIFLNSIVWFGVGIISAINNNYIKDFATAIYQSIKERKYISENKRLKDIQKTWIK